jgi:predicted glycoside hydrolase/deacetylase ChbG (UPF0249 family)
MAERKVIINGDDFGLSDDVNRGISTAFEQGILTSTSLMAAGPAAAAAAAYGASHPQLSVGLHVDLGSWVFRNGEWVEQYHVVSWEDADAVAVEVTRQLELFRSLLGRNPTHLDSHQRVHLREPARSIFLRVAHSLNIPLRQLTPGVSYNGSYYGRTGKGEEIPGALSPEKLMELLKSLAPGITELGCHPGLGPNIGDPVYNVERERELAALLDPRVRKTMETENIELCSFTTTGHSWNRI